MKANSWASLYGARRRAIDKAILQECEHQIAREEPPIPDAATPMPPIALNDEELNRIARAFGRRRNDAIRAAPNPQPDPSGRI